MKARPTETIEAVRAEIAAARRQDLTIGLVPTMGALHVGHGALIERARRECGWVVVSIFVNPLQFGPAEDFESYPRDLAADVAFCRARGVDAIFAPAASVMYAEPSRTFVEVEGVGEYLCGPSRPGHFRGVATVVLKLFNIIAPDRAYFGEKDAQQLKMIERMTRDLNLPLIVVPVPTVREKDGLAVSSRNRYLTPEQRQAATALFRALSAGRERVEAGERDSAVVRRASLEILEAEPQAETEYLEIVDSEEMRPVEAIHGPVRIATAVRIGSTRLIDNMVCGG